MAAAQIAPVSTRRRQTGLLVVTAAIGIFAVASWLWPDSAEDGASAVSRDDDGATMVATAKADANSDLTLKLGMLKDDVMSIEKEPIARGDDRWDYGPSWIAFERGKVTGWYSSPLRPLKRATAHPPQQAIERAAR